MEPSAERELILRCRKGEQEAFEPIVRTYEARLYGFLLGLTRDPDDARDLLQETFIRAWQRLDQYQEERPLLPWLFAIARSRFRDVLRSSRNFVRLDAGGERTCPELPDPSPRPDDKSERRRTTQRLWEALGRLDRTHREVLVLKDISGLPYADMAAILDIPVGTVASRVYYARRALREKLGEARHRPLVPESAPALH